MWWENERKEKVWEIIKKWNSCFLKETEAGVGRLQDFRLDYELCYKVYWRDKEIES